MRHDQISSGKRRAVNLSLDTGVVDAARKVGINLSEVSEAAIRQATRAAQETLWKEENREWIDAHNAWIDRNGIPLSDLRIL